MKNGLDEQYIDLLKDILENGVEKNTRNGKVLSVFGRSIRYKFKDGKFPLLTTKKMAWKTMVTELLWFLRGDTNIRFLVDNNCHIWDGDAYKNYDKNMSTPMDLGTANQYIINGWVNQTPRGWIKYTQEEFINKIKTDDEFAKKWGSLGKIYGKQWRSWTNYTGDEINEGTYEMTNEPIDQISELIKQLKDNPDSRRMVVSAWAVHDLPNMVLPPCHYGFQVYTRELSWEERFELFKKQNNGSHPYDNEMLDDYNIPTRTISLMWNQRSCDFPLGIPMNIASYGLLLEIIAKIVNMVPDELIGNFGDCHIYLNQIEGVKEQIGRPYTPEERHELLKTAMGDFYQTAVDEQVPFGGGLSEYYEAHKIPYHSRESFELPTLKLLKTDAFWNGFDVSLFGHLEPTDFIIENYQSHPKIFFPLSN